ncbi:Uncharacterized conserved protein YkwD, contains CAP (CSP/antigen 5/PR1) domain [Geodermatophilus sp. DSM 45219]|nr:Uncharacterized conserved protein YkwD, contains CAP (CSP/antigen 5/PR1) domain [Geodermatophilus sp. DSM 45219]
MHHMPAGPPLSSRIAAALSRWVRLLRLPRLVPLLVVAGAVAVVTLGAPMVSGAVTSFTDPVALESTATSAAPAVAGTGGSSSSGGPAPAPLTRPDGTPAPTGTAVETPSPEAPAATPALPAAEEPAPAPVPVEAPEPEVAPRSEAELPAAAEAPAAAPAPLAQSAPADPSAEGQVLALVNAARAEAGCGTLTADSGLAAVARAHSADMRDRDYFSHTSPEGLSPFDRAERAGVDYSRAENIAFGQADAAAVMEAWLDSPGHRANILDCELTKLGVGVAEGTGGPWWTQLFGA